MSEFTDKLAEWTSICNQAVDDYLDLMSPFLLEQPKIEPKLQWILKYLAISCNSTTVSALILIGQNQLWDAEILLRSVIEGTAKFVFLCVGNDQELKAKADEYLDILPEIDEFTQHKRVEAFLASVRNPNDSEWDILKEVLLDPSKLALLQTKYPRRLSQPIKQKWAFNEIVNTLSNSGFFVSEFDSLRKLLSYSYGISSHLIHQDGTALKFIWDRNRLDQESYENTQLAFASRQINDLLLMANFRSLMVFVVHQTNSLPVKILFESHKDFLTELSKARQDWFSVT